MKPRTFGYFLREALHGLVRNRLMTITALGIITIGLFLFGIFLLLTANLRYFTTLAWKEVEVRVFLQPSVTDPATVGAQLATLPGVAKITFVPKAEGAATLERLFGQQGTLFLNDENPLPDAYTLSLAEKADPQEIAKLATAVPGVEEVICGQDFVEFLEMIIQLTLIVGLILLTLTALAVLYIVVNTIQLTVYARRKEVEIMKLVGATDSFVRWPFLLEGIILGLLGAGLAFLLLSKGYGFLVHRLRLYRRFLPLLSGGEFQTHLMVALFTMGLFFGGFGSHVSLKRYLKV
ncbi:MAG TPA: ABC transporter permease [Firmicutes bacterium]|nr:ABC transporter permease [Bacillota bacterium]